MANPRPNIILFFTDQQRWDTLGCYGQPDVGGPVTPHLDRMAAEGVRFENAFTCQPVCGPARASLQTGKYATETTCYRNAIALPSVSLSPPGRPTGYGRAEVRAPSDRESLDPHPPLSLEGRGITIAHHLSRAGYEVGYIGKWHLADQDDEPVPPEQRGGYADFWLASNVLEFTSHAYDGHMFDGQGNRVEFPPDRYRVDALTDFACDYLRTYCRRQGEEKGTGSIFGAFSENGACPLFRREPAGSRRYERRPFFLFLSFLEPHFQNDHQHFEGPRGSKERFKDFPIPGDLVGHPGDWQEEYPDYLGCVNALDAALGRLRAELKSLGLEDDTLLIFTSDHGCHFRTRNREYKRSCHESSIRIPLIALGPGFRERKGSRPTSLADLVSLIDLPPTILTAAGVEPPVTMRGHALQTLVTGAARDWPDDVFVQISESQVARALRTKRWKYCVSAPDKDGRRDSASDRYVEECLYDLEADPFEQRNLVADPALAAVRRDLASRLKRRMVEAGEHEPAIDPQPV